MFPLHITTHQRHPQIPQLSSLPIQKVKDREIVRRCVFAVVGIARQCGLFEGAREDIWVFVWEVSGVVEALSEFWQS